MKKILFILPEFGFGGTVFSTLNMISLLRDKYEISVLPMSHQGPVKEKYIEAGVNILPEDFLLSCYCDAYGGITSIRKKFFATVLRLFEKLSLMMGLNSRSVIYTTIARKYDGKFDYVACCQEGASTIFLSKFCKSKTVAWFRSEYSVYRKQLSPQRIAIESEAFNKVGTIVCVSQTTRDDLANYFPHIADRIIAIHNIQNCENIIEKSKEKVEDVFNKNVFNIVSVGRFAPQKQFHLIPGIAHELQKRGCKFCWYIIGDGNQEGANDKLKEELNKYKNQDVVKCIGSRLNPYPYIAMADILVSTSYYEACPRVVAESKIIHTPVISSDYSSAREFVVDGVTGYVEDINNLADIISDLIQDRSKFEALKKQCTDYNMDCDVIMNKLVELFS